MPAKKAAASKKGGAKKATSQKSTANVVAKGQKSSG